MEVYVKKGSNTQPTYYATLKRRGLINTALKPVLTPQERRMLRRAKHDSQRRTWKDQ